MDAKGRIVLPQDVRERLGIAPGTEVEVREGDGRAIVEPEDDPERIVADLEEMIDDATSRRKQKTDGELDPESRRHVDAIRWQAGEAESNDE